MLSACSDDGAIILKHIKSLLEPLSADRVKEYAGEEAGVELHDIGNTLAETWSALSVAKEYLGDSFITDSIMAEMDYDIDRHVKKYRVTNTLR